jgi:transglutaminase-like putative cysteine protease
VPAIDALRARLLCLLFVLSCATGAHAAERGEIEKDGFRFSVAPVPAWVQRQPVAAQWPRGFAGDSTAWRYWLVDSQADRRGGRRERYLEQVYEPLSAELLDEAAQYTFSFEPAYQRLVIHEISVERDGRVQDRLDPQRVTLTRRETQFEARQMDGRVSALVVLDDIRVGDRVRVAYTIEGGNPVMGGLDDERVGLQWTDPIALRHVRVLFDPGVQVESSVPDGVPQGRVRNSPEATEFVLSQRELEPLFDEGDVPAWHPVFPELVVTEKRAWRDVVTWALPMYEPVATIPDDLAARIAQWRELPTEPARALAALRFVQDDIRYFAVSMGDSSHRPNPPGLVVERRYGDCKDKTRLLVEVYRRLGIDARPALVSIRNRRAIEGTPPSAGAFDHVIVSARIDGATFWLDPTASQQRGALSDLGTTPFGYALPIEPDAAALVVVDHAGRGGSTGRVVETVTPGGSPTDIAIDVAFEWRGSLAEEMRRARLQVGDTRFAEFLVEVYAKRYAGAERQGELRIEDAAQGNGLLAKLRLKVPGFWRGAGPGAMLGWFSAMPVADETELPKVTVARRSPVGLVHPYTIEHRFVIESPRGWTPSLAEGDLAVKTPGFDYARTVKNERARIEIAHTLASRADHVAVDALAEHFEGLRRIHEAAFVQVSLGGRAMSNGEREKRMRRLLDGLSEPAPREPAQPGGGRP